MLVEMKENDDFGKASRSPVLLVVFGMLVGLLATWCAVRYAFDVGQRLMNLWDGRDAAILFMTLRQTLWQSALFAGGLAILWRLACAKTNLQSVGQIVSFLKLSIAVLFAIRLSSSLGMALGVLLPSCNEPIDWLHGWRIFQIVDLGALVVLIPPLLLAAEWVQKNFTRSGCFCRRICFIAAVAVACAGVWILTDADWGSTSSDGFEEIDDSAPSEFDSFRLTEDEPGEVLG